MAGTEASRELAMLSEVRQAPESTQRELATKVGLSLGATNLLIKGLVTKGYLRVTRVGWRRWLYGVTPAGIKREVSLSSGYVTRFLQQYRYVHTMLRDDLGALGSTNGREIAVYGRGDLMKLVRLVLEELGNQNVSLFVPSDDSTGVPGVPTSDVAVLDHERFGWVVVADIDEPEARHTELEALCVPASKIQSLFNGPRRKSGRKRIPGRG